MKELEQYEDDIYKCSRCGLCQSACPIYSITGSETTVSRGFFSMLLGGLKGHLTFNKKIRQNLDKCLHCNICKDYCPSGIDPEKIMSAANAKTFKYANPLKKLALRVTYSKIFLKTASLIKLYRFFPILNFCKFGKIINAFIKPTTKYKKIMATSKSDLKVAIFPGCINNYFNSSTLDAMKIILESQGIEYTMPKEFECCTIASYHTGDIKNFKKFAKKNISTIPQDIDYLLFDCASCLKAFKLYGDIFNDENTHNMLNKCMHINEFLIKEQISMLMQLQEHKIATYHKPCHLTCEEETAELIQNLSIELEPTKDEKKCCGMAGLFSIDNLKISNQLTQEKAKNLSDKSSIALTDCPLCRLGILKGAVLNDNNLTVKNPIEILSGLIIKKTM